MNIRKALLDDKQDVFILAKALATSFDVEEDKFNIIYEEYCTKKDISLIVADIDKEIIGYCLAFHHKTFYANGLISWIEELMVKEDFRGKNVGSELMIEIERIAKERGSNLIALATRRAADFYLKNNYEESATYFRKIF